MDQPAMMLVSIILFAALGVAVGAIHFVLLGRETELLVRGGAPLIVLGAQLGRMALTVAVLVWAAREGAAPLLAAAAGFLLARQLIVRRLGARR